MSSFGDTGTLFGGVCCCQSNFTSVFTGVVPAAAHLPSSPLNTRFSYVGVPSSLLPNIYPLSVPHLHTHPLFFF